MAQIIATSQQERLFLVDEVLSVGTSEVYIGVAKLGSSTTDSAWQIRKITTVSKPLSAGSTTTIQYANGSRRYNSVWDDHLSLTYQN